MTRTRAGVIAIACLAAGALPPGWFYYSERRRAGQLADRLTRLESSAAELRARLDTMRRSGIPNPEPPEEHDRPQAVQSAPRFTPEEARRHLEAIRMLEETKGKLEAAERSVAELQNGLYDLQNRFAALQGENEKLQAAQREAADQLATNSRLVAALQAELKGKSDRMAQLELRNRSLERQRSESAARLEAFRQAVEEMEDIQRRREVYLNAILRRYREITDLYRTLILRLDANNSADANSLGANLSRIQNAVSLSEEDLRQLQLLNAQARQLQKKSGR